MPYSAPMDVTFWAQPNPGIRYVRCELPARALGGKVTTLDDERNRRLPGRRYAELVDSGIGRLLDAQEGAVSVWQLPASRIALLAMAEARRRGCAVVVEIDDDYTEWRGQLSANAGWTPDDVGDLLRSSVETHRFIVGRADAVIVSTPYLAERYAKLNPNVHVCMNTVDPAGWNTPLGGGDFTIGWAGTISDADWPLARKGMDWAARQGIRTVLFGDKRPFPSARYVSWTHSLSDYRSTLVDLGLDVGIRPLQNTEFARSKSDLRILEYAMAGALPIVSMVEPYLGWRDTPVMFASTPRDWEHAIRSVVKWPGDVAKLAAEVREIVLRGRGPETAAEHWTSALRSVATVRSLA